MSTTLVGPQKDWLCAQPSCRALLGKVQGDVLRIKHKDLYITITAAKEIVELCRKCGTPNTIQDAPEVRTQGQTMGE